MISEERKKALDIAMAQIEKNFGKGSVMKLGELSNVNVDVIPSGALSLDIALGVGGFPRGRVIEIYGPESSGKTTVALHAIAEAQKQGGIAAFIDAEHALDPVYVIRSGAVDLVTVDSVAALVPKAEIDGEMGDSHVGLQARLMSQALRKLTGVLNKSKTVAIFINQLREKVGIMFGNPETTPGGRALKFYSSVRLEVRKQEAIKQNGEFKGNRTKVKVVKNKVAPPFREAEFDIIYGEGISNEGCVLDTAADLDIVNKSGAWYAYNGEKIGQGRENAKQYLKDNSDIMKEIEAKVKSNFNLAFENSMGKEVDGKKEELEDEE